jgi:hypothetical protein
LELIHEICYNLCIVTVHIALWYFIYLNEVLKLLSVHIKEESASDSGMKNNLYEHIVICHWIMKNGLEIKQFCTSFKNMWIGKIFTCSISTTAQSFSIHIWICDFAVFAYHKYNIKKNYKKNLICQKLNSFTLCI